MDAERGGVALELSQATGPESGTPAPAPAPRQPRAAAARQVPRRDAAYSHLTVERLRSYRKALDEEENRVSYWRRILQARLDVVRAGLHGGTARPVDTEALRPVLTDARVSAGRRALVDVLPSGDMPPMPQLQQLWERQGDPADPVSLQALEQDLARAERELSDYRAALHRRITEATGELIARYREAPSLCLTALPLTTGQTSTRG